MGHKYSHVTNMASRNQHYHIHANNQKDNNY